MGNIKGLTVSIGADTKQFDKDIKKVDKEIRNTNNQVNALTKSLELDFNDERFGEAMKLAQKVITDTEFKAQKLREEMKYLEDTGNVDSNGYKNLQTQLIRTESDAVLLKNKLEEINKLKLDRLSDQVKSVGDGITKAGNVLKPFSIAATGILASFVAIGKSSIASASTISDFSQQVNISAESLQKWQYVALQSGLENAELQNAFIKTQSALADLSSGAGGKGAEALSLLGISTADAAKGMGENLDLIISRLASIEDPIQKALIANEIFGDKLGAKLIPLLNNGSEGLATLTAEFESFGFMTNEQVEGLSSFDDVLNTIKVSLANVKNQIGAALLPMMQILASFMSEKVVPAIQKLSEWFINLDLGQQKLLFGGLVLVAGLAPVLLIIGKITSGIGGLISSTGGLTKALTFLSAHPIVAVLGAVAALLTLLYTTNETFRESINNLVSSIGGSLAPILEVISSLLSNVLSLIMPIIDLIATSFAPLFNLLATVFGILGESIRVGVSQLSFFTKIIEVIIKIIKPLIEGLTWVYEWINKVFGIGFDWVLQKVRSVTNAIAGFFEDTFNWVIDKINWVIERINKLTGVIGVSVDKIDRVDFTSKSLEKSPITSGNTTPSIITPEQAITNTRIDGSPQTVITNDYSSKDVKIDVHFNNYAKEFDEKDFFKKINLHLANQF